jgi:hypothetical protein
MTLHGSMVSVDFQKIVDDDIGRRFGNAASRAAAE